MSISEERDREYQKKLQQQFTDRYELTRLFVEFLNQEPSSKQILFLYGDGGNGKSMLLDFLRLCRCNYFHPEDWQQIRTRSAAEVATRVKDLVEFSRNTPTAPTQHRLTRWWRNLRRGLLGAESVDEKVISIEKLKPGKFIPIPAVELDFGAKSSHNNSLHPFYGLLRLRQKLRDAADLKYRLRFPLYDFACIWYLHEEGKSPEDIKKLFPLSEVAGLLTTLIDVIHESSAGAIVNALFEIVSGDLNTQLAREHLKVAEIG